MYLFAYSPDVGPPASKPPGLNISAASPPNWPKDGIWGTLFLNRSGSVKPTFLGLTFAGFTNTFGNPTKVYAITTSLVIVGLNTCVNDPVTSPIGFCLLSALGKGPDYCCAT